MKLQRRLLFHSALFAAVVAFSVPPSRLEIRRVKVSLHASVESPPAVKGDSAAASVNGFTKEESVSVEIADDNPFETIAGRTAMCLYESDLRRDAVGDAAQIQPSSATNWINDASAFALQKAFDKVELKLAATRSGVDRDEASSWIRWMKSAPDPLIVDLSDELREIASEVLPDKVFSVITATREQFLSRMGCRLVLLPSGASLKEPFSEPPASIIYGKLLYGGVTRFRLLMSSNSIRPPRRAGEYTEVKSAVKDNVPVWMMYGGPNRCYEAMDMGPAAVLEVLLLPKGTELPDITEQARGDMTARGNFWEPQKMLGFVDGEGRNRLQSDEGGSLASTLSGRKRNEAFRSDFQSRVGGLQPQIDSIVRRVLDGRVIRPAEVVDAENEDEITVDLSRVKEEAEELALLGLTPVKGLLLYGPPGCGKTALAREISSALRAREPKIVSAPELLDRWVGGSEKLVRALFADAEAELTACNGDATRSALHVIVIDEIDAVFRKRSSAEDSGEATRASAVNQILAKLDGVNAIPNVLLIGMTNRRELLDEALLRPGRLEVQIEIPLPNKEGRREILNIHFDKLRKNGKLSKPLCCAIDGVADYDDETDPDASDEEAEKPKKFQSVRKALSRVVPDSIKSTYDLAADYATGGYSGADIAGLVRCAGSIALERARKDGSGVDGLLLTLEDVKEALRELGR